MNKTLSAAPKLRFPGDVELWEEKKLGEIGTTYSGLSGKNGNDFGSGEKFITYMQIFNSSKIEGKFGLVNIEPNENQNLVKYGDIFFTTSSETPDATGYTSVLLDNFKNTYLNSFCFGYRADKNKLIPQFARYLFHSPNVRKLIIKLAQGSTRYNISKIELMKLRISLPPTEEQQKIADFLTSVDEEISALENKLELMQKYKKGIMQQIFSQKIRFKDDNGKDFPKWEETKISDILREYVSKTDMNSQYEVLSSTSKGIFKQSEYFNKQIASDNNTGYKIIKLNQIVFSPQNLWMGNINLNTRFNIGIVSPSYKIFDIAGANVGFIKQILKTKRMLFNMNRHPSRVQVL